MILRALFVSALCSLTLGASVITIMPLGDSITAGTTGLNTDTPGGYRNNLYADLTAAGYQIQFVGSQNTNPSTLLTANNETAHEGHIGYMIEGGTYNNTVYQGLYENIDTWFASVQPDIVILLIGTNDIDQGIENYADLSDQMGMLLDKITADDPGVEIILSTLIYTTDPTLNMAVTAFNAELPAVAATRPNVTLVDNSNLLDISTDYDSTLHPNEQGYEILGDAFATEVESVLSPEPASIWLMALGLASTWLISESRAEQRRH
jgi:lysophospholipase L1-like esterase